MGSVDRERQMHGRKIPDFHIRRAEHRRRYLVDCALLAARLGPQFATPAESASPLRRVSRLGCCGGCSDTYCRDRP